MVALAGILNRTLVVPPMFLVQPRYASFAPVVGGAPAAADSAGFGNFGNLSKTQRMEVVDSELN